MRVNVRESSGTITILSRWAIAFLGLVLALSPLIVLTRRISAENNIVNKGSAVAIDESASAEASRSFFQARSTALSQEGGGISYLVDRTGDGVDDVGVFRESTGTWFLLWSSSGYAGIQFGASGDVAVPAGYIP